MCFNTLMSVCVCVDCIFLTYGSHNGRGDLGDQFLVTELVSVKKDVTEVEI